MKNRGKLNLESELEAQAGTCLPLTLKVAFEVLSKVCIDMAVVAQIIAAADAHFHPGILAVEAVCLVPPSLAK